MAKTPLPWAPVREILKSAGGEIVSKEAVDFAIVWMVESLKELAAKALKLTVHSNRKKLTRDDLDLAAKMK